MKSIFIYGQKDILKNYLIAFGNLKHKVVCSTNTDLAKDCSVLVLAGGGDINPTLYGQTNYHSKNIDYKRDLDELFLIDEFIKKRYPIIGICRGLQVINTYFGGTLIQHIGGHSQINDKDIYHKIVCRNKGVLHEFYGNKANLNSAHHQAINTCGKDLLPDGICTDGVIESVYHYRLPIFAMQFHPERLHDGNRLLKFISEKYIK